MFFAGKDVVDGLAHLYMLRAILDLKEFEVGFQQVFYN